MPGLRRYVKNSTTRSILHDHVVRRAIQVEITEVDTQVLESLGQLSKISLTGSEALGE